MALFLGRGRRLRGQWHMVEVAIAIITLVLFLIALRGYQMTPEASREPTMLAYEVIQALDDQQNLRSNVISHNYDAVNNSVQIRRFNRTVRICDYADSCWGSIPSAGDVWSGTYIIAGNGRYQPHVVQLYFW